MGRDIVQLYIPHLMYCQFLIGGATSVFSESYVNSIIANKNVLNVLLNQIMF